jgi:hypothetical protein
VAVRVVDKNLEDLAYGDPGGRGVRRAVDDHAERPVVCGKDALPPSPALGQQFIDVELGGGTTRLAGQRRDVVDGLRQVVSDDQGVPRRRTQSGLATCEAGLPARDEALRSLLF